MRVQLISSNNLKIQELTKIQKMVYEDLELAPIIKIMSKDDEYIRQTVLSVLFDPIQDETELLFRQTAVRDAINHPGLIKELYQLANEVYREAKEESWGFVTGSPSYQVYSKARLIKLYLQKIDELKKLAKPDLSDNFTQFFQRLQAIFTPERERSMAEILSTLLSHDKYSYPASLSYDMLGEIHELDYHKPESKFHEAFTNVVAHYQKDIADFTIGDRDDNSSQALERNENHAESSLAVSLINSESEMSNFFEELRRETSFLLGVINLYQVLPDSISLSYLRFTVSTNISDLRNLVLVVNQNDVVPNDFTDSKLRLLIISGANQGGKTTSLRSLGQAQLFGQAGVFVTARTFETPAYTAIMTHFKREEDTRVTHGKLDEELSRMDLLIQNIKPQALMLMNESFSSTNEHEGSIINGQIMSGLVNSGNTVIAVTHQYEFSEYLRLNSGIVPIYMRAQRSDDGSRNYKILLGKPRQTSYGLDIFNRVFYQE